MATGSRRNKAVEAFGLRWAGAMLLAGCTASDGETAEPAQSAQAMPAPVYAGIETLLLDDDLVNFVVRMRQVGDPVQLRLYSECAAAQYTVIRGYEYLRHVRTQVSEEAGIWRADAVYTISPDLPRGLQTIDAAFTVALCKRSGVPTV